MSEQKIHRPAPPEISEIIELAKSLWHADSRHVSDEAKVTVRKIIDLARNYNLPDPGP